MRRPIDPKKLRAELEKRQLPLPGPLCSFRRFLASFEGNEKEGFVMQTRAGFCFESSWACAMHTETAPTVGACVLKLNKVKACSCSECQEAKEK